MNMPEYKGKCPNCGREAITGYEPRQWYYGSPVKRCKKCGFTYLDKRYHEIETDGYEPDALSVRRSGLAVLLGLGSLVIGTIFVFGEIYLSGRYHTAMVAIAVIGIIIAVWGVIDIIRIKTGLKQKKLEKLQKESEKRLSDRSYALLLAEQGYNVPERYLGETVK